MLYNFSASKFNTVFSKILHRLSKHNLKIIARSFWSGQVNVIKKYVNLDYYKLVVHIRCISL